MSRRTIGILTIAAIIVAAIVFLQISKGQQPVEAQTLTVSKGSLEEQVSGSGVTEAAREVGLNFAAAGKVDSIEVEEGAQVTKDQELAILDQRILKLQRRQQAAALSEASAAYQKLRTGASAEELRVAELAVQTAEHSLDITRKKANLDIEAARNAASNALDSRNFALGEREEALAEYNKLVKKYEHPEYHIPNYTAAQQSEVDTAKATADLAYSTFLTAENAHKAALRAFDQVNEAAELSKKGAEDALETARAQLALKKAPLRSEDARSARARISQAQALLDIIDEQIADMTLKSPFDGTIIKISTKEDEFTAGSASSAGGKSTSFMIIADRSTIRAVIDIDEADISNVKPEQAATAFLDAYKDLEFSAKVIRVGDASVKTEGGGTAFPVYVDIQTKGKRLWSGMNVDVDIVINRRHGVISVPAEAVTSQTGKDIVYVIEAGRAAARTVKVGTSTDIRTEIITGLKEGDIVVTSNISKIKDGSRIKS